MGGEASGGVQELGEWAGGKWRTFPFRDSSPPLAADDRGFGAASMPADDPRVLAGGVL